MSNYSYKNLSDHYSDLGSGPVLVLLHGFLEDLSMWNHIVDALKKTNRVICVDLLGHGKTENLGYIHSMEDQSDMLKQLLDSLFSWAKDNDLPKVHLKVYPENAPAVKAYEKAGFKPYFLEMRVDLDAATE